MSNDEQLRGEALSLIQRAWDGFDSQYGSGSMSCAIYDTAWVSLVYKVVKNEKKWLFPDCFRYVLDTQSADGGWGRSLTSQVDGILNTAASLLSLKKYSAEPLNCSHIPEDIENRIGRGVVSLRLQLETWDVPSTTHVGFEVIVPAMLKYLQQEDKTLVFEFDGRNALERIRATKLSHFNPELLYGSTQSTALHSLEAFIGIIDFDKVAHHKIHGAMMASPSSTAACLLHSSMWDNEAEKYLEHVLASGAGKGSGGVPSAYPSMHFEYTWMLSTLTRAGFAGSDLQCRAFDRIKQIILNAYVNGNGVIGFAPMLEADVDDTAKCITTLVALGHFVSADKMIESFEAEGHFKTYAFERDPSFSANCNALSALLCQTDVTQYFPQIHKIVRFLCDCWWNSDGKIKDKWNSSYLYPCLLLTEVMVDLLALAEFSRLADYLGSELQTKIHITLFQVGLRTLLEVQEDGSWNSSIDETAYGVLILSESRRMSIWAELSLPLDSAIERGVSYIRRHHAKFIPEPIWIEKVSYASALLTDCYVLAALKKSISPHEVGVVGVNLATNMSACKDQEYVKLLQETPLFAQLPEWQIRASLIESVLFRPLLRAHQLDIFPRMDIEQGKYFDIIPMSWTSCNNRVRTFAPTAFIYEMMVISLLNYQADAFMEAIAEPAFRGCTGQLHESIDELFSEQISALPLVRGNCSGRLGYISKHGNVLLPLYKFVTHVLSHPFVMAASAWDREHTKRELQSFLHAHAIQNEDNARLETQNNLRQHGLGATFSTTKTFFNWVRTTSSDHTSCPYSFYFVSCFLSTRLNGRECFQTVREKYLAAATCRHLSTSCRMYNDYGSVIRDADEENVNSVNFPEYRSCVNIEEKKRSLFELAQYEQSCLEEAMNRLGYFLQPSRTSDPYKARQMAICQMFCDVTNLYGQIYVLRDCISISNLAREPTWCSAVEKST
ncbi:hypothetical protein NLG97_g1096 [Lecanicillium saksenae]|uniref:Uncharacterized protein n=1 Tax=Lecanicillium saksenae TaxID=468837 RepID=A0ACC1R6G1_9HYPO|nr:hypothetical protein NLG97_g1096 [Lecanicillium saksenae]